MYNQGADRISRPVTARIVPPNVNSNRPIVYMPSINRSFIIDLKPIPSLALWAQNPPCRPSSSSQKPAEERISYDGPFHALKRGFDPVHSQPPLQSWPHESPIHGLWTAQPSFFPSPNLERQHNEMKRLEMNPYNTSSWNWMGPASRPPAGKDFVCCRYKLWSG